MPGPNYRQSQIWQEAVDLAVRLDEFCSQLPPGEEVLIRELLESSVALAAAIGQDLAANRPQPGLSALIRVDSGLELVRQIYPALDTGEIDKLLESIFKQIGLIPPDISPSTEEQNV